MRLVKLPIVSQEFLFQFKLFWQCFNYQGKLKKYFHGHLTQFKFEENMNKIGICSYSKKQPFRDVLKKRLFVLSQKCSQDGYNYTHNNKR